MSWTKAAHLVRTWREITHTSQGELARQVDVSISTITRLEAGTDAQPPKTQPATLVGVALAMGEPRGSELLELVGLEDRIPEYRRSLRAGTDEGGHEVRNSLSYGGAPLTPEQEEAMRDVIRTIQRAIGDRP